MLLAIITRCSRRTNSTSSPRHPAVNPGAGAPNTLCKSRTIIDSRSVEDSCNAPSVLRDDPDDDLGAGRLGDPSYNNFSSMLRSKMRRVQEDVSEGIIGGGLR